VKVDEKRGERGCLLGDEKERSYLGDSSESTGRQLVKGGSGGGWPQDRFEGERQSLNKTQVPLKEGKSAIK